MSEMEKNRQVVQDGLDRRKAERKMAEEDAYQEAIETEMINVVDKHYHNVEAQKQKEIDRAVTHKTERLRAKKIAATQEKKDGAVIGVFMSLLFFAINGICYITEITALWNIIASTALTSTLFLTSIYFVVSSTIKIAKLS